MPRRHTAKPTGKRTRNTQRGGRLSFSEALSLANRQAHEKANRRSGRRQLKSVRAAIDATDISSDIDQIDLGTRLLRWLIGMLLIPACCVTTYTLLSRFSHATLNQGFWQTAPFWYFATGALLMGGWFASGLLRPLFLYLYVLGHELTHVIFVIMCRGKVSEFHVSSQGGYITTNKTNLLIALSPYFLPFWSLVCTIIYVPTNLLTELNHWWHLAYYALIGITWTFHMLWTLWMIPRDQPDLKENGTFLSLVIIYLANLLILSTLLCAAEDTPLRAARSFATDWLRNAAISTDVGIRWGNEALNHLSNQMKF